MMTDSRLYSTDIVRDARVIAAQQHAGQKYGSDPYFCHLEHVAGLADDSPDIQAIAYLHDIVEDTDVTIGDLNVVFGHHIAHCVSLITDPNGSTREVEKLGLHMQLKSVGPRYYDALHVKAADRLANLIVCKESQDLEKWKMYVEEHEGFYDGAYRRGIAPRIWQRIDELIAEGQAVPKV